ncbi:MAG TPA: glucan biosynthesis protein G [Burkholderiaceae bacterium]|nr:glucan biosynthesis protein G [Burkholderiaceae bacterium]
MPTTTLGFLGRWACAALGAALLVSPLRVFAEGFSFETVAARAQALAQGPYLPPSSSLPPALLRPQLTYEQHRDIRFRPERAQWRSDRLPFELMFFHPGWLFEYPVRVHEVEDGRARELAFDASAFEYGRGSFDADALGDIGFAGFRVLYPLNTAARKDEVIVFLGASYFRAVARGARYGLSARALAVDTAGGQGEEFPRFVEFWVERPTPQSEALTIYALLDSPRVAGAYRFVVTPGEETVTDVRARIYLRAPVATLGIAPLTSMYFAGENQPAENDFRPEVHDSDGLSLQAGNGEWIWRPLVNPRDVSVSSFATVDPRGFGLMQRDRAFAHYEDLEARYEVRPSAWIEPLGAWGAGRIELVQFGIKDETDDNVVAYWVPARLPAPGEALDLAYRVRWQMRTPQRPPQPGVVQTRRGHGYTRLPIGADEFQFVLDFDDPASPAFASAAPVMLVATGDDNAEIQHTHAYPNDVAGGWRATLRFKRRDPAKAVELRAFLRIDNDKVSETWSYLLPPHTR